jgi:hypothetical protein
MQKHKVWLSIIFSLGVFLPVLFFTPVAALQDNPDQIQSNKTKRPTVDWDITATSVSTRESRFNSSSTSISPSPSSLDSTPTLESTLVPSRTERPTQVNTLDPDEAEFQPTLDAIATNDALIQIEKKKNPQKFCGGSAMVIPVGLVMLALFKRRSKNIYL